MLAGFSGLPLAAKDGGPEKITKMRSIFDRHGCRYHNSNFPRSLFSFFKNSSLNTSKNTFLCPYK
jgi:hypothetical protein